MVKGIKLSDAVIDNLKNMIAANLKPGDRLPTEKEMAQIFGVGRSSIREGLKVLSSLGLVERRNEGTFVQKTANNCLVEPLGLLIQMELAKSIDILEFREIIELGLIKRVVQRATDEDIITLEQYIWQMAKPGLETEQFIEADVQFHNALAVIADNIVMSEVLKAIRTILKRNHCAACGNPKIQELAIASHKKLLQAVKGRNAKGARKYMEEHLKIARVFHGFPENEEDIP